MLWLNPAEAHFFVYTRAKIIQEQRRHEYELMRMQTYKLFPNFTKTYQPTIEQFLPFPWDAKPGDKLKAEHFTEDAFQAAEERVFGGPFIQENKE